MESSESSEDGSEDAHFSTNPENLASQNQGTLKKLKKGVKNAGTLLGDSDKTECRPISETIDHIETQVSEGSGAVVAVKDFIIQEYPEMKNDCFQKFDRCWADLGIRMDRMEVRMDNVTKPLVWVLWCTCFLLVAMAVSYLRRVID